MAAASLVSVYYGRPMLPDVSRVLACLFEKEIEFKLVDMYDGQHMPLDALKLQTTEKAPLPVPALEDGATFLTESRNICRYLSEKYAKQGNRYLLGRDLLDRGLIEQWLKTEEQSFNPPSWELVFHLAFSPLTSEANRVPDRLLLNHSEQALAEVLDVYEHRLREREFLACDEFTLADLSHLPNTHYVANSKEWNHLLNSRKNVMRWWELISNRPSWVKVIEIMNEVEDLKVVNGAEGASNIVPHIGSTEPGLASQISLGTASESNSPAVLETGTQQSSISQSPNAPSSSSPKSNHIAPANVESATPARFSSETGGKKTYAASQEPKQSSPLTTELDAPETFTPRPNPKLRSPPEQGSSTGLPTPVTTKSNLKKDTPLVHLENSEMPNSGSSSTTPDRPSSQASVVPKAKQE